MRRRAAKRGICRSFVAEHFTIIVWPPLCLTRIPLRTTRAARRARELVDVARQLEFGFNARRVAELIASAVHFCTPGLAWEAVRIRDSRLCDFEQAKRSFQASLLLSSTAALKLVPFEGVVGRGPSGGVCPNAAHRYEPPHFSLVSDTGRNHAHALLSSIFAPCMHVANVSRSALFGAEKHSDRSSVLGERSFAPRCFRCPQGLASLRTRESFIRYETRTALSCVNAWDTM